MASSKVLLSHPAFTVLEFLRKSWREGDGAWRCSHVGHFLGQTGTLGRFYSWLVTPGSRPPWILKRTVTTEVWICILDPESGARWACTGETAGHLPALRTYRWGHSTSGLHHRGSPHSGLWLRTKRPTLSPVPDRPGPGLCVGGGKEWPWKPVSCSLTRKKK